MPNPGPSGNAGKGRSQKRKCSSRSSSRSSKRKKSSYPEDSTFFAKLCCFYRNIVTKVMLFVFHKGSQDKTPNETLWDYYHRKCVDTWELHDNMKGGQKKLVDNDRPADEYDITLLYFLMQWGHHGLKKGDDSSWYTRNDSSIEYLLTFVKNKRNELFHNLSKISFINFWRELRDIQDKLIKILNLSQIRFRLRPCMINDEITKVRNSVKELRKDNFFEPQNIEQYKKRLIYDVLAEDLKTIGTEEIIRKFNLKSEHMITPLQYFQNFKINPLPLINVYCDMAMGGMRHKKQQNQTVTIDNVLVDEKTQKGKTKSVIVISAQAGAGKSTLTKKMTYDWKEKKSQMKHLAEHDLVFKVECRSRGAESLTELITSWMPDIANNFKVDDIRKTIFNLKTMVILDGLDELNNRSEKLYMELLDLKKDYEFTLLITTRPEKLKKLEKELNDRKIKGKFIELLGVPKGKMYGLCESYYREIKGHGNIPKVKLLLDFLKKTQHKLADVWRLPYNLILITALFVFGKGNIITINTASKLYSEIHNLHRKNLKERILTKESKSKVPADETTVERKIDQFIYTLSKESLTGVRDDNINLPQESYDELEKVCNYNNMNVKEMAGAFLQPESDEDIHSTSIVTYSIPHKGLQDYLGALYIWYQLTGKDLDYKEEGYIRRVVDIGQREGIHPGLIKQIQDSSKCWRQMRSGSSSIKSILEEMQISCTSGISKYRNLFFQLTGILFLEKDQVNDEHRKELLKLLQETGMKGKSAWLGLLSSVDCDSFVASFINEECNLLNGDVRIESHTLTAYISLLKSIRTHVTSPRNVSIDLDVKGELYELTDIVTLIQQHQLRLRTIVINDNYQELMNVMRDPKFPTFDGHEIDIDINAPLGANEYVELKENLKSKELKIRTILIGDNEITSFTNALRDPIFPSFNPQEVNISIDVSVDLPSIKDLLEEIKGKQLIISKLKLDIDIEDSNAIEYSESIRTLPQLMEGAFEGEISINLDRRCEEFQDTLREISKNQLPVNELCLQSFFKNPGRSSKETREYIDQIIKSCSQEVNNYTGPMTEGLVQHLFPKCPYMNIGVTNMDDVAKISTVVNSGQYSLQFLRVCIAAEALRRPTPTISPLNGVDGSRVVLFFPDIKKENTAAVATIAKKLQPIEGFLRMYFPRLHCKPGKVIQEMEGVRIRVCLSFPSVNKPKDAEEERDLQKETRKKTGCRDIEWGSRSGILDINSW